MSETPTNPHVAELRPVLEAIIDSTAHGAYPRAGLLFSRKSDEPAKGLITLAKHNLSATMPPLVYRVDTVDHERVGAQPALLIEGPSAEQASRPVMTLTQELRAWVRQWIDRGGWIPAELLFEFGEPLLPCVPLAIQRFQALGRRIADQLLAQLTQLRGIATTRLPESGAAMLIDKLNTRLTL